MPRLQAAQQLAALTDTPWIEGRDQLSRAAPVTLHWRGRDAVRAWQHVLGEHIRHAVHCNADGCRVWILAVDDAAGGTFVPGSVIAARAAPKHGSLSGRMPEREPAADLHVGPMNTPTPPSD